MGCHGFNFLMLISKSGAFVLEAGSNCFCKALHSNYLTYFILPLVSRLYHIWVG